MELIDNTNSKMFTRISHHQNCNTIFITHAVFMSKNESYKMMSKNAKYFFLMKNPRDVSQVKIFSSQIGINSSRMVNIFKEATKNAYSYLFVFVLFIDNVETIKYEKLVETLSFN